MGCRWTLDDICETNGVSINTNDNFLKCFIQYGSTVLYTKWVLVPTQLNGVHEQEALYCLTGFNGYIGSLDALNVQTGRIICITDLS